jgi:regulator of protease activity HflC (stomatin/prohibitin superfamily)
VRLISPDITHDVSSALAKTPIARATKEQTVIASEGEQIKLTNEGKGRASAELALLVAQADGQEQIMKKLGVTGDSVLAAETAGKVLEKTDVLVVGGEGGLRDVMGMVKGAQTVLNRRSAS